MVLPNKVFDTIKWLCIFFLPALSVFIKTIFEIWQIPYGNEIAFTIVALNTFLGGVIGISNISYNKTLK